MTNLKGCGQEFVDWSISSDRERFVCGKIYRGKIILCPSCKKGERR